MAFTVGPAHLQIQRALEDLMDDEPDDCFGVGEREDLYIRRRNTPGSGRYQPQRGSQLAGHDGADRGRRLPERRLFPIDL